MSISMKESWYIIFFTNTVNFLAIDIGFSMVKIKLIRNFSSMSITHLANQHLYGYSNSGPPNFPSIKQANKENHHTNDMIPIILEASLLWSRLRYKIPPSASSSQPRRRSSKQHFTRFLCFSQVTMYQCWHSILPLLKAKHEEFSDEKVYYKLVSCPRESVYLH